MYIKKMLACALIGTQLLGCATAAKDISAAYVSPIQYQGYDCTQLSQELGRIQSRVSQLTGRLDSAAANDKMIMGAGLLIFWPALFALGGTKAQEEELSRLKGEYDAASQAGIQKNCLAPQAPPSSTIKTEAK